MQTLSNLFETELRKFIDDELMRLGDIMQAGNVEDFPDYKEKVGIIKGLKKALELCDDVAFELANRR